MATCSRKWWITRFICSTWRAGICHRTRARDAVRLWCAYEMCVYAWARITAALCVGSSIRTRTSSHSRTGCEDGIDHTARKRSRWHDSLDREWPEIAEPYLHADRCPSTGIVGEKVQDLHLNAVSADLILWGQYSNGKRRHRRRRDTQWRM